MDVEESIFKTEVDDLFYVSSDSKVESISQNSNEEDINNLLHQRKLKGRNAKSLSIKRPLLILIKRLVNIHNNKQNTVLTNSQIIDILKTEFGIDVKNLHALELDIYMNIMKKFLKDWPQWDEIDKLINESKATTDEEVLNKILDNQYHNLKQYLNVMLDKTRPLAKEAVENLEKDKPSNVLTDDSADTQSVVMEVQCTRSQLHQLIFKRPHPGLKNTIFNIAEVSPSKITVNSFPLEAILNWPLVIMNINTNELQYKREFSHKLQHTLINKKLECNQSIQPSVLNRQIQFKYFNKFKVNKKRKKYVLDALDKMLSDYLTQELEHADKLRVVFNLIKSDIEDIPENIIMPAMYRRYSNNYEYIRYFQTEVNDETYDDDKYDLYLQEKLSPTCTFQMVKCVWKIFFDMPDTNNWLKIQCVLCKSEFLGLSDIDEFVNHFYEHHQSEPDWICTNCQKSFNVTYLAQNKWYHSC